MANGLQVGIIGASVDRGWARESHVPAVQALAGLELAAVAGSGLASAEAAAQEFGVGRAYGSAAELFADPGIDIVAVCVKAPAHRELVLGALSAGKHVYCEWPLGRDTPETEELAAAAAAAAGVHTAIGLQTRANPAAHRARELIADGAIGRVLTVRIGASTVGFGPMVEAAEAYTETAQNGATLVTLQGGHTLDLATAVLGGLTDLAAMTTTQYSRIQVGAASRVRTTPDHLLMQARLPAGGALSAEVTGGRPPGAPFRFEVLGERGTLVLEGGAPRGFQAGRLDLTLCGKLQRVDEGEVAALADPAANVAGLYAALRDDIVRGTWTVPDFQQAVRLARLIDAVMSSARTGKRVKLSPVAQPRAGSLSRAG